jgi:hypothetical protein
MRSLGAVLYRTPAGNSYAIDAAGTASLVGIDGLTLSGSLARDQHNRRCG